MLIPEFRKFRLASNYRPGVDSSFAGSSFAAEQQFSTSPLIVNPVHHANGVFEFDFTNRTVLNILVSTKVTLPFTKWTNLGPATSLGDGVFRFTDSGAMGQPRRFYMLHK
jgi:hypothetical protein